MAVSFINLTFFKNFFGSIVNALFISKIPLLNTTLFIKKKRICVLFARNITHGVWEDYIVVVFFIFMNTLLHKHLGHKQADDSYSNTTFNVNIFGSSNHQIIIASTGNVSK